MDPELDEAPEISEYYVITLSEFLWHLHCVVCNRDFSIPRRLSLRRARQALLDHARSHQASAREEVDRA